MPESSKVEHGEVVQWLDNKGYGFVARDNGKEKVFFHISCVKNKSRRPQMGDLLSFIVKKDRRDRWQAEDIFIENLREEEEAAAAKYSTNEQSNTGGYCKKRLAAYVVVPAVIIMFATFIWLIWR